ncbi:MAG: hypothetical protein CM15mP128_0330 [Methanobacteriota archaeon]|nr:MAG: hypothetical protein CM15mP128_0330 [Euryarchaeota archaeon]
MKRQPPRTLKPTPTLNGVEVDGMLGIDDHRAPPAPRILRRRSDAMKQAAMSAP